MMNALHQEGRYEELELKDNCIACGGTVHARFTPGSALGVCVPCHLVTPMVLFRQGEAVRGVQMPLGHA
jgi:hypothetical protein